MGYAFKNIGDYNNAKKYFRLAVEKGNVDAIVGYSKLWREKHRRLVIGYQSPKPLIKEVKNDGLEVISWFEKASSNGATFDSVELANTQLTFSRFVRSADEKIKLLKKSICLAIFLVTMDTRLQAKNSQINSFYL